MVIWLIWLIVAIAVIAAKYYTSRTITQMRVKLTERGGRLSEVKMEGKVTKSSLEVAKRNLVVTQRKIVETKEHIEKLKPELKALEELEVREIQAAKDLVEMLKDGKGR